MRNNEKASRNKSLVKGSNGLIKISFICTNCFYNFSCNGKGEFMPDCMKVYLCKFDIV